MRKQALFDGQSSLIAHSGRQFGGNPWKSGIQVQDGAPFTSRHKAFGPQGFGTHGLDIGSGGCAKAKM